MVPIRITKPEHLGVTRLDRTRLDSTTAELTADATVGTEDHGVRLGIRQYQRRVEALAMRATGASQIQVAERFQVHPRTIQRWEELHRLNALVPPGKLNDVLKAAFEAEAHAKARATLLAAMAGKAQEEARLTRARIQRGLLPLPEAEAEEPPQKEVQDEVDQERARRVAERALAFISRCRADSA